MSYRTTERILNWRPDLKDPRDFKFSTTFRTPLKIPKQHSNRHLMHPIRDQGNLGSCTGFSGARMIYAAAILTGLKPELVSPLYVYYNGRYFAKQVYVDSGAYHRDTIKGMYYWGGCLEDVVPYRDVLKTFDDRPSDRAYSDGNVREIRDYYKVEVNATRICEALAMGFPVMIGSTVTEHFMSPTLDGQIEFMKNDSYYGGHSYVLDGYRRIDGKLYFDLVNSWGTYWGVGGYAYISAEYIEAYADEPYVIPRIRTKADPQVTYKK